MKLYILILSTFTALLCSVPATAAAGGQFGASGRPNGGRCNMCHGTQTYENGVDVVIQPVAASAGDIGNQVERKDCYARVGNSQELQFSQTFYVVQRTAAEGTPAARLTTTINVNPPPTSVGRAVTPPCSGPQNNPIGCNAGEICSQGQCFAAKTLYCPPNNPADAPCAATPTAGFALEANGGAYLETFGDGQTQTTVFPPGTPPQLTAEPNELVQTAPQPLAGPVSWNGVLNLTPAFGNPGQQSVTLYAAVNATNNNGLADPGDITSYDVVQVYFSEADGTSTEPECQFRAPDCSAVEGALGLDTSGVDRFGEPVTAMPCLCPEGQIYDESTTDEAGNPIRQCIATPLCSCNVTASRASTAIGFCLLALFGALFVRRRG